MLTEIHAAAARAEITFAVTTSSLGAVLVARSARGVRAILFGDDAEGLTRAFQDRFPRARPAAGDAGFKDLVAKVVGLVDAPRGGLDLPLDLNGTAFQQKVWRALREIPAGETASYGEVAEHIGLPRAVRAVARACAANDLAVVIPCHRVVRRDGTSSGYRWGVARKLALLEREAAA